MTGSPNPDSGPAVPPADGAAPVTSAPGPASPPRYSESSIPSAQAANEHGTDAISPVATAAPAAAEDEKTAAQATATSSDADPLSLGRLRHQNVTRRQMKIDHPTGNAKGMKKYYTQQNELIDQFLNSGDEERLAALDEEKNGPKVKFAINASFAVNFCLFIIQLYAAISTGSLSLFATAADAFMDLVSSCVMFITSRLASRPSVYKYPVGRTRIETIGIILFCALMTTVAVQLIIESGRTLGAGQKPVEPLKIIPLVFVGTAIGSKFVLFCYCFALRRYPAARVFYVDHRNDLVVNCFGLVMSIVGDRFVWFLDPIGAICIGLLILFSWVSNAFEQVWLLVGKSAPRDFLSKVIYMCVTHDDAILKVDTVRAYHAGQKFYVEVDVIMDETAPLKVTHDVSQILQRKLEGLADVERAFVHVDYEDTHDVNLEHKPLYEAQKKRRSLKEMLLSGKKKIEEKMS